MTVASHMGTLLLAASAVLASSGTAPAQTIAPEALQADLRFALDTIEREHPDLAHSVAKTTLERAAAKVRAQLDHPMAQAEAWATLAQLNPVLADGHLFIGLPDWRGQSAEAVRRGTGFFPFEVAIDAGDHPVIVSMLGGGLTPLVGRRILQIDGHDARDVARSLLARAHGDTPAFRRALLAQRWWLLYAKLYGTPADYGLVLSGSGKRLTVPAGHTLPAVLQRDASFDRLFACRINTDKSARLTVASFVWEDKVRYLQFTHDCFARIRAASVDHLVIDVSANGGGDDDMWKDGILRYLATRPYKQGSTYRKREASGAMSAGTIENATQPVADEPLRFPGKVTVEIGPLTYSSAVLFANVVRDYRFGILAGVGGAARTQQSGGVRGVTLPNTGLILSYPRFVLDPPAGSGISKLLQPMTLN
ncbi:S41 family peptidase [Sphingomonas sp. PB4P5]|uniref:S41 family peptidase n=1 Tax=Parasphingomonas puruogangriensis TaxID=3096155 RepID=UPI002FCC656B